MPWVPVTPSLPSRARPEQTDRGHSQRSRACRSLRLLHTQGHVGMRALRALPVNSGTVDSMQEGSDRILEESFPSRQVECPKPGALKSCPSSRVVQTFCWLSARAVHFTVSLDSQSSQIKSSLLGKQDDVELQLLKVGQALRERENPRRTPRPVRSLRRGSISQP